MPLVHGHGHRRMSLKGGATHEEPKAEQANGEDETGQWSVNSLGLEAGEGALQTDVPNLTHCPLVLSHIISQLRPGADLSRVVLPTFILEPRSMLERITKCECAPDVRTILLLTRHPASWHTQNYSYPFPRSKIQLNAFSQSSSST
ncbi:MAG: hypothetical protein Q9211_006250 [Gyalolechia sp. 1 TL-2023]